MAAGQATTATRKIHGGAGPATIRATPLPTALITMVVEREVEVADKMRNERAPAREGRAHACGAVSMRSVAVAPLVRHSSTGLVAAPT